MLETWKGFNRKPPCEQPETSACRQLVSQQWSFRASLQLREKECLKCIFRQRPNQLIGVLIDRFSFPGQWVLDASNSNGKWHYKLQVKMWQTISQMDIIRKPTSSNHDDDGYENVGMTKNLSNKSQQLWTCIHFYVHFFGVGFRDNNMTFCKLTFSVGRAAQEQIYFLFNPWKMHLTDFNNSFLNDFFTVVEVT